MAKKNRTRTKKVEVTKHIHRHGPSGAIYGLGFIGALIYYISNAATFWMGVIGVLKAFVWPAFLVHGLLKFLGL